MYIRLNLSMYGNKSNRVYCTDCDINDKMIKMLNMYLDIKLSSIWCVIITVDHLLRMYLNPGNIVKK